MKADELKSMIDLITDAVEGRLCTQGLLPPAPPGDSARRSLLKADFDALSEQLSLRSQTIAEVRAVIAEHGFRVLRRRLGDDPDGGEARPDVEELRPPDFGPDGPSDADIQREIEDLMRKLERLRNPGPAPALGDDDPHKPQEDLYPLKRPGHVQIDVGLLVSILVELFMLILKLIERLKRLEQPRG